MKVPATLLALLTALVLLGCGSEAFDSTELAVGASAQTAPPETAPPETTPPEDPAPETAPPETAPPETAPPEIVITWQTLGCPEPAPLTYHQSEALESDATAVARLLKERYGLSTEEGKRRLRLQGVLSEAAAEVQQAEDGRVAFSEFLHEPTYAAVVTLTGSSPITSETETILCRTPELEVRLGALYTQSELSAEGSRLASLINVSEFGLTSFGPGKGEIEFSVIDEASVAPFDAKLMTLTNYPFSISVSGLIELR